LYGGVNQYARLLGLFTMQGNTHFKNISHKIYLCSGKIYLC
jgi:hypothetical protein